MKNPKSRRWILPLIIVLLLLGLAAVCFFVLSPMLSEAVFQPDEAPDAEEKAFAEEAEQVDYDEETGLLYMNSELIVTAVQGAAPELIAELAAEFDARLDDTMGDLGIYLFRFDSPMTYDELISTQKKLRKSALVDSVCTDALLSVEGDVLTDGGDDDFEYRDAVYPDDPWDNASWNMDAPGGCNWGVEAIRAPGAWGYLSELSGVKLGVIDSMPDKRHTDLSLSQTTVYFVDDENGQVSENIYSMKAEDHGTHVSGIMCANWNSVGVSGIAGGKGELSYSAVYYVHDGTVYERYATAYSYLLALRSLIDSGAQVVNISQNTSRLLGFAASRGNKNAINYLNSQAELAGTMLQRLITSRQAEGAGDFVICVAAGNNNNRAYYKDEDAPYGYREKMTLWEAIISASGESGGALAKYNNFLSLIDVPEVRDRIVVVGACGLNSGAKASKGNLYSYSRFSNVGDRVDITAPGERIYSSVPGGFDYMNGTSMATPMVSAVAGLIFAGNPTLTGPQVKQILTVTADGRFYYDGGYSGLLNAEDAVICALRTKTSSVSKVLRTETSAGLDLCFVVDTTGSMDDDIDNTKENMDSILAHLAEKSADYRVALVDYRDFSSRSNAIADYPSCVQLPFSSDNGEIAAAINALTLGDGGDRNETVYSGLMSAVELEWRSDAQKVIIILGDAAPLDPEPVTGYTYDTVVASLRNADIYVDTDASDDRVLGEAEDSLIQVYSIGTSASSDAMDFFGSLSADTGGSYSDTEDASQVADAVIDSIEQIEITPVVEVPVSLGEVFANETLDLYRDSDFLFSFTLDGQGETTLDGMEFDGYTWRCEHLGLSGDIKVKESRVSVSVDGDTYWFTPLQQLWRDRKPLVLLVFGLFAAGCALLTCLACALARLIRRRAASRAAAAPAPEVPVGARRR